MASLWDDVKNAIVDGYVYAADKAEELTQIGRARVEILRLNRAIARTMTRIGGRTFELYEIHEEDTLGSDEEIRNAIDRIRTLQQKIAEWEEEIERAKEERDEKAVEDSTDETD
jgi:hypothetical protein